MEDTMERKRSPRVGDLVVYHDKYGILSPLFLLLR